MKISDLTQRGRLPSHHRPIYRFHSNPKSPTPTPFLWRWSLFPPLVSHFDTLLGLGYFLQTPSLQTSLFLPYSNFYFWLQTRIQTKTLRSLTLTFLVCPRDSMKDLWTTQTSSGKSYNVLNDMDKISWSSPRLVWDEFVFLEGQSE